MKRAVFIERDAILNEVRTGPKQQVSPLTLEEFKVISSAEAPLRKLKAAGFVEKRQGKGAHVLFVNPKTGKEVWVTMHGHDAGRLGHRILRDAGVE